MLDLELAKQAEKFLKHAPSKHAAQLARKIRQLQDDPHPNDAENLRGYPYFRADAGEYRIIYEVENSTLFILLIGKRNDDEVYKKLKRKMS